MWRYEADGASKTISTPDWCNAEHGRMRRKRCRSGIERSRSGERCGAGQRSGESQHKRSGGCPRERACLRQAGGFS
jgi:hypothetical protein